MFYPKKLRAVNSSAAANASSVSPFFGRNFLLNGKNALIMNKTA